MMDSNAEKNTKELISILTNCVKLADNELLQGKDDCGCGDPKTCSYVLVRKANLDAIAQLEKELSKSDLA